MALSHDYADDRTEDAFLDKDFTFEHMLLREEVLAGLFKNGFVYPTVIQKKGIQIGRCGYDLLIQSKSGTGKTLVYSVIILEKLVPEIAAAQSLVIAPTREIAVQSGDTLMALGKDFEGFKMDFAIGGSNVRENMKSISNANAIVGTPGRILDLIKRRCINLREVKIVVLDEVDLLMKSNFKLDEIMEHIPLKPQIICVSATFDKIVEQKVKDFMQNPIGVTAKKEIPVLLGVGQFYCHLDDSREIEMIKKFQKLKEILSNITFKQCFVFTNSQSQAASYKQLLQKEDWPSEVITGAYDQKERLEIYRKLKEFKIRVLLSTDLMARGIDAENVNLVINLETPINSAVYLHRIGRAGRFGSKGLAITLIENEKQKEKFKSLISDISENLKVNELPKPIKDQVVWNFQENKEPLDSGLEEKTTQKKDEDLSKLFTDEKRESVPFKIKNIIAECDNFESDPEEQYISTMETNKRDIFDDLFASLKALEKDEEEKNSNLSERSFSDSSSSEMQNLSKVENTKMSNLFTEFDRISIQSEDKSMHSNIAVDSDTESDNYVKPMSVDLSKSDMSVEETNQETNKDQEEVQKRHRQKKRSQRNQLKSKQTATNPQSANDWMQMWYQQTSHIYNYMTYLQYIQSCNNY